MAKLDRNKKLSVTEAVAGDRDLIKELMKGALQEVQEGEMSDFLGPEPGERTEARSSYRAGYYGRSLVTRIVKQELRVTRDCSGKCLDRAVRELRQQRESAGGGAGRYVRARRPWPRHDLSDQS